MDHQREKFDIKKEKDFNIRIIDKRTNFWERGLINYKIIAIRNNSNNYLHANIIGLYQNFKK